MSISNEVDKSLSNNGRARERTEPISPNLDLIQNRLHLLRHSVNLDPVSRSPVDDSFRNQAEDERLIRHEVFSIRSPFGGAHLSLRAELHSEYWTLSAAIDLEYYNRDIGRVTAEHKYSDTLKDIVSLFDDLESHITNRAKQHWDASIPSDIPEPEMEIIRKSHDVFITKLKEMLNDSVFIPALTRLCDRGSYRPAVLGELFADFFGNILGLRVLNSIGGDGVPKAEYFIPGRTRRTRTIHDQVGNHSFDDHAAIRIVDAVWPLIRNIHRAASGRHAESRVGKPEFSVTRVQNDRAIYISSLGKMNQDYFSHKPDPVVFTIIVCHNSRWQLGRLIDRIQTLGTLRLAALWDFAKLQDQYARLQQLGREVDDAADERGDAERFLALAIELAKINNDLPGGIPFRVKRSLYYRRQFAESLHILRINRVEGFQPYDQFVQRKLGASYDFIAQVGDLYADIRSEIDLQLSKARLQQAVIIQTHLREATEEIRSVAESLHSVSKSIDQKQARTNILLDNAEILIAAPLLYYFGAVFMSIFDGKGWLAYTFSALLVVGVLLFLRRKGH